MPTLVVDQVLSGAAMGLSFGLADLLVADIGGRRVLYALSRTENVLVEISVGPTGTLTVAGSLNLSGSFAAGSVPEMAVLETAAGTFGLALAGLPESAGQIVSLLSTGTLGSQQPLTAAGTLAAPVGFDFGAVEALVTGRLGTGGLDLLTDAGAGFAITASLPDAVGRYLADVSASVTFALAGTRYVATVSATEDGVNLVEATSTALIQRDALGATEELPINTPTEIGVIQRPGETMLVIGSAGSSSLSVVDVDAGGALAVADHILDSPATRFQGVSALDTLMYGDFAFLAAGGAEGGMSLFTILPGGRLVLLASLADSPATSMYRVSAIELAMTGTRLDALIASAWEPGITRVGYDLAALGAVLVAPAAGGVVTGSAGGDQIVGSSVDDTLSGGAGDDILADGPGRDVLSGGAGADLFVLHPDGQQDEITDYEKAADWLDLSAFDFLYDISQLTISPTPDGAVLTYGSETLVIRASDGAPLTAADFSNATILNVDRPPLVPFAQDLQGGPGDDTLNGAAGSDTIRGYAGNDALTGQAGDDAIYGGDGDDWIDAGAGADTVEGEDGGDTISGGSGDDLLNGGSGDDVIYGVDWSGA